MPGSSWTVVKFNEENLVEAVPTSWIFNNQCYWPSFQRDKVMTAIRKNEEPNTHWPSYEVTIFRDSTYGNHNITFFLFLFKIELLWNYDSMFGSVPFDHVAIDYSHLQ